VPSTSIAVVAHSTGGVVHRVCSAWRSRPIERSLASHLVKELTGAGDPGRDDTTPGDG